MLNSTRCMAHLFTDVAFESLFYRSVALDT